MSRIYVFWIWYPQTHVDAQENGGFFLNDFFMCSNPLMEVSVGFLIELTHGGFLQVLIFHSTMIRCFWLKWFMEVLLKWLSVLSCRYYTTLLGFLWIVVIPLDGFVCKSIISFWAKDAVKWDQHKNQGARNMEMILDNKHLTTGVSLYLYYNLSIVFS